MRPLGETQCYVLVQVGSQTSASLPVFRYDAPTVASVTVAGRGTPAGRAREARCRLDHARRRAAADDGRHSAACVRQKLRRGLHAAGHQHTPPGASARRSAPCSRAAPPGTPLGAQVFVGARECLSVVASPNNITCLAPPGGGVNLGVTVRFGAKEAQFVGGSRCVCVALRIWAYVQRLCARSVGGQTATPLAQAFSYDPPRLGAWSPLPVRT